MPHVREQILVRLREVIATVPGLALNADATVRGVGRNRDDVSGQARPAIIMRDGDESLFELGNQPPRRSGIQLIAMEPELVILIGKPTEQVGTDANAILAGLLNAVLNDSELIGLCSAQNNGNGDIKYQGCEFESAAGETREGKMTVHITFTYIFRATDLAP